MTEPNRLILIMLDQSKVASRTSAYEKACEQVQRKFKDWRPATNKTGYLGEKV